MNVALLGASPKPDRYAYMAFKRLLEKGHDVFLVHPTHRDIEGHTVYKSLSDIPVPIDTLTLYVNSTLSTQVQDEILALAPRRIIFNPGTENPELEKAAQAKGVHTQKACTLVLLSTGQF